MSRWMAQIKDDIRGRAPECLADACQDQECSLRLPASALGQRVLVRIDGCEELAPADGKRCDFLLVFEPARRRKWGARRWTAPIELKSGTVKLQDIEGIREQLQRGADVAAELLSCADASIRLRPVLGLGKAHPHVEQSLTHPDLRVMFGRRREVIQTLECGDRIGKVLR